MPAAGREAGGRARVRIRVGAGPLSAAGPGSAAPCPRGRGSGAVFSKWGPAALAAPSRGCRAAGPETSPWSLVPAAERAGGWGSPSAARGAVWGAGGLPPARPV